jgi:polyisoprenoid-binding protein YceI
MNTDHSRKHLFRESRLMIASLFLLAAAAAPRGTGTVAAPVQAAQGVPATASSGSSRPALADGLFLSLEAAQSSIHWTLDTTIHTVHGTFALKRGAVQCDLATGEASGEIVADAASGKSGNDSRDKKMHQEVLQSPNFPEAIFRPDRIDGKISAQGPWTANLHGVFILHGAEHELTIPVHGELTGDRWKATAKFSVPFVQWGLKNPSNFLLKVNPAVDIEADLVGALQSSATK